MSKNILDSRELSERANKLLAEYESWKSDLTDEEIHIIAEKFEIQVPELTEEIFKEDWQASTDEGGEYQLIINLEEEINSSEWTYGLQLIADSYFEDYARELAEDLGAIDKSSSWPNNCIDWSRAASELQYDYSSVDFDGETYWYRS